MPSGGHHSPTAFILWPFSPSKKSPLDPPSPWSCLGAYLPPHHGARWAHTSVSNPDGAGWALTFQAKSRRGVYSRSAAEKKVTKISPGLKEQKHFRLKVEKIVFTC